MIKVSPVTVLSRNVFITDRFKKRTQTTRWGKWMKWGQHKDSALNVCDAVQYAIHQLKVWGVSTVVYVRGRGKEPTPIFQAKAGLDGSRFLGWKPNPVADYWRRQLKK